MNSLEDSPFSGEIKLITKNIAIKGIRKIAPTAINKKNVTVVRKNIFMIGLQVDVLMSFKTEIKELSGVVSRLTSGSPYADRDVLCSVKEGHRRIDFPETPFTKDGSYILIAKGGY